MNPSEALLRLSAWDLPLADDRPRGQAPSEGVKYLRQRQHRLSNDQVVELVRQYQAGASAFGLARTFGINERTVHDHLIRRGAKAPRYRKLRGERLDEAIRLHQGGASYRAIARDLGLDRQTVAVALREAGTRP